MTIMLILGVAALVFTLLSIAGKAPLWVAVLLLCICVLLSQLPLK
jgi:hypothetical protein